LTSGAWVDIENDGAGGNTTTAYKLPGFTDLWDTTNHEFDWSSLSLGDTVDIRFDISVTTSANNDEIALRLDMAHGSGNDYSLEVYRDVIKNSGTTQIVRFHSLYMGDNDTLNNPAKVAMFSDSAGDSVVVNGWYIRVVPRNPVFD
jgi:hypothetical protein